MTETESMKAVEITSKANQDFGTTLIANGGIDGDPDSFRIEFNPEVEPASIAVVRATALVHNVDQVELKPLVKEIDADALNEIVQSESNTIEVSFRYEKLEVTVQSSGEIWLEWP